MKTTHSSLRSHHSLKNSIINGNSHSTQYSNPASLRLGLINKGSSHIQDGCSVNTPHCLRIDPNAESQNVQVYDEKNETIMNIVGNNKDFHSAQKLSFQRKFNDIYSKIDVLTTNLEKQEQKLGLLEKSKIFSSVQTPFLQEITRIIKQKIEQKSEIQDKSIQQIYNKLKTINFEIKHIFMRPQFEKKVENCVLSVKNNWLKTSKEIQTEMEVKINALKYNYNQISMKIEEKWSYVKDLLCQFDDLKKYVRQKPQIQRKGKMSNLPPLFNKPHLRLKFFRSATLIGAYDENPQEQIKMESNLTIYKIDSDGFLLDEENNYILDEQNETIQLSPQQISVLAEHKIFR